MAVTVSDMHYMVEGTSWTALFPSGGPTTIDSYGKVYSQVVIGGKACLLLVTSE